MSHAGRGRGRPKGGKQTLLQRYEKELREGVEKGLKPKQIAETVCSTNLLPPNTITARQVSDWITYHKKNGTIRTPSVTGENIAADWDDSWHDTAKQNSGPSPPPLPPLPPPLPPYSPPVAGLLPPQPQFQPEYESVDPEDSFAAEYKTRLKHVGLYFEAATANDYHLFLNKLPRTIPTVTVQSPTSIFVVWQISAHSNNSLTQAKKINVGAIPISDTTVSLTFIPPHPIQLKFEKNIVREDDEVVFAQYIFPFEIEEEELVDTAF